MPNERPKRMRSEAFSCSSVVMQLIRGGGVEKGAGPVDFTLGEAIFPVIEDKDLDLDQLPQ